MMDDAIADAQGDDAIEEDADREVMGILEELAIENADKIMGVASGDIPKADNLKKQNAEQPLTQEEDALMARLDAL